VAVGYLGAEGTGTLTAMSGATSVENTGENDYHHVVSVRRARALLVTRDKLLGEHKSAESANIGIAG
jgi:hypothetical protein